MKEISNKLLNETYNLKSNPNIYFAGQITGVEGYVESIASGLVAGLNASLKFKDVWASIARSLSKAKENNKKIIFPNQTVIGALSNYISSSNDKSSM